MRTGLRMAVAVCSTLMMLWCSFGPAGGAQVTVGMMSVPFMLVAVLACSEWT